MTISLGEDAVVPRKLGFAERVAGDNGRYQQVLKQGKSTGCS